jgi:GDP-4-dehydro-6-deoxy-D-mannose reductase
MRVLITGAAGFSGRHLTGYLANDPALEIYCTSTSPQHKGNWFCCDLAKKEAVSELIEQVEPDQIYHLAGLNSNDFEADFQANVLTARNILETIRETQRKCRILLIGSSAEYGFVAEEDNPVREDHALTPMSVYALTKVYQTYLMKLYHSLYGLDVVMGRPFNLLGRGAPKNLFVGRVYDEIEAFWDGRVAKIVVGNLQNRRDYIHVEAAVRNYALIMRRGVAGEIYNVGSGVSITMRELLTQILKENGLLMDVVEEQACTPRHKFDIKNLVADISKLRALADPQMDRISTVAKSPNHIGDEH